MSEMNSRTLLQDKCVRIVIVGTCP